MYIFKESNSMPVQCWCNPTGSYHNRNNCMVNSPSSALMVIFMWHFIITLNFQETNGLPAPGGGTAHTGGYGDSNEGMVSGLSSVQNQVHMVIRNNPTAEGASVESVCKQIRGVPEKAIRYNNEFPLYEQEHDKTYKII